MRDDEGVEGTEGGDLGLFLLDWWFLLVWFFLLCRCLRLLFSGDFFLHFRLLLGRCFLLHFRLLMYRLFLLHRHFLLHSFFHFSRDFLLDFWKNRLHLHAFHRF